MPDATDEQKQHATELYARTVWRTLRMWRQVASLQEYMRHESPAVRGGLFSAAQQVLSEIVSRPDYGTPEQAEAAARTIPSYAAAATDGIIKDAVATAEAACFVFAHSMLDAAVDDYCEVSSILCPTDWEEAVADDTITLAEARNPCAVDEQLKNAIKKHIRRLCRQSLPNRIETLQAVCKPGSSEILKDYRYDRERISRLEPGLTDGLQSFYPIRQTLAADLLMCHPLLSCSSSRAGLAASRSGTRCYSPRNSHRLPHASMDRAKTKPYGPLGPGNGILDNPIRQLPHRSSGLFEQLFSPICGVP